MTQLIGFNIIISVNVNILQTFIGNKFVILLLVIICFASHTLYNLYYFQFHITFQGRVFIYLTAPTDAFVYHRKSRLRGDRHVPCVEYLDDTMVCPWQPAN